MLIVALVGASGVTLAVFLSVTGPDIIELEEDQQIVPVQRGDLINQISISGTLSLPNREVLRFGSKGVVEDVLIEEGQRVQEGDVLAALDDDTIASLEKAVVQVRVDLRDAEDALEDFLEPITDLQIARAEQKAVNAEFALHNAREALETLADPDQVLIAEANAKVASSRVALENARELLDDLQEPPTELQRAQVYTNVTNTQITLQNAEDELATTLESATSLQIAKAQADVTSAQIALQNAEEELATMLESATSLQLVKAQADVTKAQVALQNAEDELATTLESATPLQNAEARAHVAARELALENAKEALADAQAGASANDLADARLAVETAATHLENAQSDLSVAERDWETKTTDAQDAIDDAADAYSDVFMKWLGIEIDQESLDPDHEAALSRMGFDLPSIFGPSANVVDIRDYGAPNPADDPSTPWNEVTVFTWISMSPIPVEATCDPGDPPWMGLCVEDEFRTAADSYQAQIDNRASFQAKKANTLTAASSGVDNARSALDNAQEKLEELEEPAEPALVADLSAKVDLAVAELDAAKETLAELEQPDQIEVDDLSAKVDLASAELAAAKETLAELEQPDQIEVADLSAKVDLASAELDEARDSLDELMELPDAVAIEDHRARVALEQQNLNEAMDDLESLDEPVDETEVANQREQVALALAKLQDAELELRDLMAGTERPEYQTRLRDVEVARLDLDEQKQDLQDLLANDQDALDRELLEANIAAAEVALGQAEERLADATMRAPWDGFVSQVNVEAGEEVEAVTNVMVVVDTSVVEIDGAVDEIDVLQARVDAEAVVTMDALPDQQILGRVSFIAAEPESGQSGSGVVSYPIKVRLDVPAGIELPVGLSAVASVTISEELDVLLVPIQALRGSFDQPVLSIMVEGEVVDTPVTLGNSDDFWTVVDSGVAEDDLIVMQATDGSQVEFNVGGPPPGGRRRPR